MSKNDKEYDFSKYKLNDTDKKVLLLKLKGKRNSEISKEVKINQQHVSKIFNKPEFKKAYQELSSQIQKTYIEKLIDAKLKATEKYISLIDGYNIPIVARVCENIIQFDKLELGNKNIELPDDLEGLTSEQVNELYKRIKNG